MPDQSTPVVMAIGSHDPLGGAGIAADLTTFAALGVHGTTVLTAVTAQHLGSVDRVEPTPADLVTAQLDGIIDSFVIAAAKTGLLGSAEAVEAIAERVHDGRLPAPVVDPVLVDGRGRRFVPESVELAYRRHLFPAARVLTPNVGEAALLVGRALGSVDEVVAAAPELAALGADVVVVTGGSFASETAVDVVVGADGSVAQLVTPRRSGRHVRGSGCTFASAIAARLATGVAIGEALADAKQFVDERLAASTWPGLDGVGPVAHWID